MKFLTTIDIHRPPYSLTYDDRILMLGSCFSDEIARKLGEYYFRVDANPFGTLYNPVSIARHLTDERVGQYSVVILTFGTAWVYVDRQTGEVVDNCEKRPASDFIRRRLTVEEVVATLQPILERHPAQRFILTVSPIRHLKDGLHENNLSKAILLQAIETLTHNLSPVTYFPSYEILLDELRDYRFYADDLMHPSRQAVEYIFERFAHAYIYDKVTQQRMQELHSLWLDRQHRPLHPDTPEAQAFARSIEEKAARLRTAFPWI